MAAMNDISDIELADPDKESNRDYSRALDSRLDTDEEENIAPRGEPSRKSKRSRDNATVSHKPQVLSTSEESDMEDASLSRNPSRPGTSSRKQSAKHSATSRAGSAGHKDGGDDGGDAGKGTRDRGLALSPNGKDCAGNRSAQSTSGSVHSRNGSAISRQNSELQNGDHRSLSRQGSATQKGDIAAATSDAKAAGKKSPSSSEALSRSSPAGLASRKASEPQREKSGARIRSRAGSLNEVKSKRDPQARRGSLASQLDQRAKKERLTKKSSTILEEMDEFRPKTAPICIATNEELEFILNDMLNVDNEESLTRDQKEEVKKDQQIFENSSHEITIDLDGLTDGQKDLVKEEQELMKSLPFDDLIERIMDPEWYDHCSDL